jgi:iron complex transport system ATP-binding protein
MVVTHAAAGVPQDADYDTAPALVLEAVSFAYGDRPVLQDVSLRFAAGEMVALLGPNGAGKTTLLRLASAVLTPASGRVTLHGRPVVALSRKAIARAVAVLPQDFSVQFAYTTRQVVELGRLSHAGALGVHTAADREAVERALAATNMLGLAERIFNELSGGERQRALVALALAQESAIILLDEPTAHLDVKHQIAVLDLLHALNRERGTTIIAAIHDLNLAARYFPRLVLLDGTVRTDGAPSAVLDAALLASVYGAELRVGILPSDTHLSVLPPSGAAQDGEAPSRPESPAALVHVIAGGGSGALVMRALADAAIPFTAGPFNVGDGDEALARRLATQTLSEPPATPFALETLAALRAHVAFVRALVICPLPLGLGNLAALDGALEARRAGTPVLLFEPDGEDESDHPNLLKGVAARDFSGQGVSSYQALLKAGASHAGSIRELVALLSVAGVGANSR